MFVFQDLRKRFDGKWEIGQLVLGYSGPLLSIVKAQPQVRGKPGERTKTILLEEWKLRASELAIDPSQSFENVWLLSIFFRLSSPKFKTTVDGRLMEHTLTELLAWSDGRVSERKVVSLSSPLGPEFQTYEASWEDGLWVPYQPLVAVNLGTGRGMQLRRKKCQKDCPWAQTLEIDRDGVGACPHHNVIWGVDNIEEIFLIVFAPV